MFVGWIVDVGLFIIVVPNSDHTMRLDICHCWIRQEDYSSRGYILGFEVLSETSSLLL